LIEVAGLGFHGNVTRDHRTAAKNWVDEYGRAKFKRS
jgi:hypothetical protein